MKQALKLTVLRAGDELFNLCIGVLRLGAVCFASKYRLGARSSVTEIKRYRGL